MRAFWGAFDVSYGMPQYSGAALQSAGSSAVVGSGVGVRRAQLRFSRTPPTGTIDDVAVTHIDFMNLTSGSPDDTWTTTDFTDLESIIAAWWTAQSSYHPSTLTFDEIRWYRVGTGITPPNPAVRIHPVAVAGSAGSESLPPQVAATITLKTAARKNWGRLYLPHLTEGVNVAPGIIGPGPCATIADNFATLVTASAAKDMHVGVLSHVAGSWLALEQIQVDNVFDVIRSRRWRNASQKEVRQGP